MSKPVHGDARYDEWAIELYKAVIGLDERVCRNLNLTMIKKLTKAFKHSLAELEDAIITKQQQSIGGRVGSERAHKKRAKTIGLALASHILSSATKIIQENTNGQTNRRYFQQ